MNNRDLSKYFIKAANALKLVLLLVMLLFVVFLLSCILMFREHITIDNVQYLMKYADFYDSSHASDEAEISITSDSNSHMFTIRDNLAVVTRSGIGLYEFSGHKLFNYNFSYSTPAAVNDGRNILVYDITGTQLSIFNSFSRVFSQEYPYSVKTACISPAGFAVVTGHSSFRSVAIAYNSDYKEMFRWECSDRYITSVDLSDDGAYLLCTAVKSSDGIFNSQVIIYDTRNGKAVSEYTIEDELTLKAEFSQNRKNIVILTDSKLYFSDDSLVEINEHKYNQSKCESFFVEKDCVIITESNNLSGNSIAITGFDFEGNLLFSENADSKVSDISVSDSHLFALSPQNVYIYAINDDNTLTLVEKKLTGSVFTNILSDNNGRYIIADSKKAQRFKVPQ